MFCRRTNAEISFGYVRLSGRMKKLRYVNRVLSIVPPAKGKAKVFGLVLLKSEAEVLQKGDY